MVVDRCAGSWNERFGPHEQRPWVRMRELAVSQVWDIDRDTLTMSAPTACGRARFDGALGLCQAKTFVAAPDVVEPGPSRIWDVEVEMKIAPTVKRTHAGAPS